MNKISDRILKIVEAENISIRHLEQLIGSSNGVLSKAIKKGTDINSIWVSKIIEKLPQYNPEWVLTGEGEMLRTVKGHADPEVNSVAVSQQVIPLVDISAVAGFGTDSFSISENDIRGLYVIPDFGKIDFMIHVFGNSMYPKYNSGDIIACRIIKESRFIQWNKCHVIATSIQGILVKRLMKSKTENCIQAVSDNVDYPPFDVPLSEVTGLALVVGVIRLE